jgi:hypothetical protein
MSINDPAPVKLQQACAHLRHKLMYGDARQAIRGEVEDSSDTTVFFCIKTFEGLGPDDKPVSPADCTGSRACYCQSA